MNALVRMHRDLRALTVELGKVSTSKNSRTAKRTDAIRQAACQRIAALTQSKTFWLKSALRSTSLAQPSEGQQPGDSLPKVLIGILEDVQALQVTLPARDAAGMHLCVSHALQALDTPDLLRYITTAARGNTPQEDIHALLEFLYTSKIERHLGLKQTLRVGIALKRWKAAQAPRFPAVCAIFFDRLSGFLLQMTVTDIVLSMQIFSQLVPSSALWEDFFRVFLANHITSASEVQMMQMVSVASVCRLPKHMEVHVFRVFLKRLCVLSRAPAMAVMDEADDGVRDEAHSAPKIRKNPEAPTKEIMQAALGCCVAYAARKILRRVVSEYAAYARYASDYLVPLCLSVQADTKGPKAQITLTKVEAVALCTLLTDVLAATSRFSSAMRDLSAFREKKPHAWWRKNVKGFVEACVVPVIGAEHQCVRAVLAERNVYETL